MHDGGARLTHPVPLCSTLPCAHACRSVDVRIRLVLDTALHPEESIMFLYSPPGDASIGSMAVIAPHLDVPAEESESGVTLTLGSDVEPEFKGATQFEGTLTLSQWSSRNGMCVLLTSRHPHHDLLERVRSVVPTCLLVTPLT
jgi:hypothetical protein